MTSDYVTLDDSNGATWKISDIHIIILLGD